MDSIDQILKKYWGFDQFRPLQREIIESVLSGLDTLALLPTGGGKSLCFQVPALVQEGLCLVISPLIALMKDQVSRLDQRGIPALAIHSGMSFSEVNNTLKNAAYGNFKFLYVSPERLRTELFQDYLPLLNISSIAIDEAHCISQWGYDFRPSYLQIAELKDLEVNAPMIALTASATPEVQEDICQKLLFRPGYKVFRQSFVRPNLSYSVFSPPSKENKVIDILGKVKGSSIIYCRSRKRAREVASLLTLNGISADFYHAGLTSDERNTRQDAWIKDKTRVICCTNAFGMGIDKANVRTVIHYDVPESLENYYQEAGRAGRDGKKSYAVLLYHQQEISYQEALLETRFPPMETIRKVYASLCNYFQLGAGRGGGMSFDFEIADFVTYFKHDARLVSSVLKILEQEDILTYSQRFFAPSTVAFNTDKRSLETFEESFPIFVPLIKGLLRSYDNIFDDVAPISEFKLAVFIGEQKEKVTRQLEELNKMGIIDYTSSKDSPQVYFIDDRATVAELHINQRNLRMRKDSYERRLEAMINYTRQRSVCRSNLLADYFMSEAGEPCGVCDNCLSQKKDLLTISEFKELSDQIKEIARQGNVPSKEVTNRVKGYSRKKAQRVLAYLMEEESLYISANGMISTDIKKGPR